MKNELDAMVCAMPGIFYFVLCIIMMLITPKLTVY